MKHLTTCLLAFLLVATTSAQELPRRAFLGIRMEAITEDVQRVMKLPTRKGVLVQQVIEGSTAAAAGLQRGDILLELDGKEVNTPNEAVSMVGAYRGGQTLRYKVLRGGKTLSEKTIIQGLPKEVYSDLEVTYSSVKAGDAQLRTILTKPKNYTGKLPALLFIQGIGCYSMDTPFDTLRPEIQLLNHLARQGFAVMRVDKSGLGDSNGAPCEVIDFFTELEGYKQAFAALQQSNFVDASNCFLYGHSMGGIMAPLLAKDHNVKGIAVYGTIGVNFMEYFINTRRTIAEALELDAAATDTYIKRESACAAMLLCARLSREEAVKFDEVCGDLYDILLLRSDAYWRQLYALNAPSLWQSYSGHTLAAWGSTDYISARREHEMIAAIVNQNHPGHGTFLEIPDSNHGMHTASTFPQARTNPGPYNPAIEKVMEQWLKELTKKDG